MPRYIRLLSALMTATLLWGCGSDEAISLSFKPPAGSKVRYTNQMDVTVEAGPMASSSQKVINEYSYESLPAGDSAAQKLVVTIHRIRMSRSQQGLVADTFDSDHPGNAPAAFGGGLINRPYTLWLNQQGAITRIEGLGDMTGALVDSTDPNAAAQLQELKQSVNDSFVINMIQQSMDIYPEQAVKPGDTWTKNSNMRIEFMEVSQQTTYKLESVENGLARISLQGTLQTHPQSGQQELKIEVTGSQKGQIELEVASGILKAYTLDQDIKGSISLPAMGSSMPVSIRSVTRTSSTTP